ncbi:Ribosomal_protein L18 [Hexamita inflata]|uniref:Ribosomal_protein L18 n=1 Tax=Hexamita inflata TaxID=28002 RepID=A0ABP1IZX9_9EUKA
MSIYHKTHELKRHTIRKAPKSKNFYLRTIQAAFDYAAKNLTETDFAKKVARRLCISRSNRPVMSLSNIAQKLEEGKIAVIASTITNDERLMTVPKMTIVALHFTATAKARIEKAGGKCMTFDTLLLENPSGKNCQVLQGTRKARKEYRYFGAAGLPGSTVEVKGDMKGRKGARGPHSW